MKSYFRPEIDAMAGYVPGEQPKMADLVKLNTNENPFAPSPEVEKALKNFDPARLRRYPDPMADSFRDAVAAFWGVERKNVIAGNGSDDLLTMIFRAFSSPQLPVAVLDPSYSLYPELAAMQGAPVIKIKLAPRTFALPEDLLEQAQAANLLMIVRPNAPTGTLFPKAAVKEICEKFDGIVVIDEAYGDFASVNCMDLAKTMDNVIVIRTFSKSYAMAGIRLGYGIANETIIAGLMKVKDSYNIDMITQLTGEAAFRDQAYFAARRQEVIDMRRNLAEELKKRGFYVPDSESNFLFVSPPDGEGKKLFEELRKRAVIVRYFSAPETAAYLRITIGNPEENARLLAAIDEIYG
jgi:histidinol-phosphate aminotransferase